MSRFTEARRVSYRTDVQYRTIDLYVVMNHPLLKDCVKEPNDEFLLPIPKPYREKFGLASEGKCVLAWMSEDCVSVWCVETWQRHVESKLDAVLSGAQSPVPIETVRTICRFLDKWQEVPIQKRGGITLPKGIRDKLLGSDPTSENVSAGVRIVDCGLFFELWRPSAWHSLKESIPKRWDEFWTKVDSLK